MMIFPSWVFSQLELSLPYFSNLFKLFSFSISSQYYWNLEFPLDTWELRSYGSLAVVYKIWRWVLDWYGMSIVVASLHSVHTYIIGHYNPSVTIIDLVSHTTYVVCVNFTYKRRDLQFKVDSERQIFWETFHGNFYLLSEFLSEMAEEILFVFSFDVWPGIRTLVCRLISQHTTY